MSERNLDTEKATSVALTNKKEPGDFREDVRSAIERIRAGYAERKQQGKTGKDLLFKKVKDACLPLPDGAAFTDGERITGIAVAPELNSSPGAFALRWVYSARERLGRNVIVYLPGDLDTATSSYLSLLTMILVSPGYSCPDYWERGSDDEVLLWAIRPTDTASDQTGEGSTDQ